MQSLNVTPYSLKTPTSNATQINEVLDFLKELDTDWLEESTNVQICHNIEDAHQVSITDYKVNLDPRAEFEENQPTFDGLINV